MSVIVPYFKNKTIFLTGATGFLGKLLMEQLLRKCEPKRIYLLIREKRGIQPEYRLQNLFNDQIFDRLKNEKPFYYKNVEFVPGDLTEEYLGITEELKRRICEEVDIVIHSAATVKFNEPLRTATNINVKGTISVIKLCYEIKKLQVFMYISTLYSNYIYSQVEEKIYDHSITCDELITLLETLDDNQLNNYASKNLSEWPNTYTLTKALAENAIKLYAEGLPVVVFRPGVVAPTLSEPLPGWSDKLQTLMAISVAVSMGSLKILPINSKSVAHIVPCDLVACCILVAVYKRSKLRCNNEIPIYNFLPKNNNHITWGEYVNLIEKARKTNPGRTLMLPNYCIVNNNTFVYRMSSFCLHFLPAVLLHLVHLLIYKQSRILNKYKRIINATDSCYNFFKRRSFWNISDSNVIDLWKSLNNEDKMLFNFDMNKINWPNYSKTIISGLESGFNLNNRKA